MVGLMAATLERARQLGQLRRHLARDARAGAARVQAVRIQPDAAQGFAHFRFGQVGQRNAVAARVRERGVGCAAARELRIQLDDVADIDHQHEGRPALGGRQGARIAFGLGACTQQRIVKTLGAAAGPQLLGLEHEMAAVVAVDAPGAGAAVAVVEGDGALEHVVRGVRGSLNAQQRAQLQHKTLGRGEFAGARIAYDAPARDELVGAAGRWLA